MKNTNKLFLSLAALTLIISSCATGNKYSKTGFGGGFGEGKKNTNIAKVLTQPQTLPTHAESAETQITKVEPEISPSPAKKVNSHISAFQSTAKMAVEARNNQSHTSIFKALKEAKRNYKKSNAGPVDKGNIIVFILLFILCFIIPPLAYYLATGEIDTKFWICLICAILASSYFYFQLGGLFWLISVVLALLGLFS